MQRISVESPVTQSDTDERPSHAARRAALVFLIVAERPKALAPESLSGIQVVRLGRAAVGQTSDYRLRREATLLRFELADDRISTRHADLSLVHGAWILEDRHSKNGTRVNGVLVERATLCPGDVVEIGRSFAVFCEIGAGDESASEGAMARLNTWNPDLRSGQWSVGS